MASTAEQDSQTAEARIRDLEADNARLTDEVERLSSRLNLVYGIVAPVVTA